MIGNKEIFISIRENSIAFNSEFVKKADIQGYERVTIFLDPENYKIGFKFHNKNDRDSWTLYPDSKKGNTRNVSIQQIKKQNKWIKSICEIKDLVLRRFVPKFNNIEKLWEINLSPSFENKVSNVSKITSKVKGIYRYLKDKEIVYIGKGIIKSRANSPERQNWEFDTIEYSIIEDPERQSYWEAYWLDKFVEQNDRLPIYNKILGKNSSKNNY